jgi:hypothetical protein
MLSQWGLLEKSIEEVKIITKRLITSELKNAYFILVDPFYLIRSGSIDTPAKAQQFLECIQKETTSPLRILSCQINNPEHEWELIQSQHRRLAALNQILSSQGAIAHLVIPVAPFFIDTTSLPQEFMAKALAKLCRQLNSEGWMTFSRWLNEEMEATLKTFKPEAADEYQLQARLEDFGIETHSLFLNSVERELQDTLLAMNRIELGEPLENQTLFSLEKKAISLRERLKTSLEIKYVLLNDIVTGIGIIEAAHPELISLKMKAFLLATLLGQEVNADEIAPLTAEQQLLMLQLLNQQLRVVTAVNCDTGLDRTSIAISLMLSIAELCEQIPIDQMISMILNWDGKASGESDRLRRCVAFNLEQLSWPIIQQVAEKKANSTKFPENWEENLILLSYLPPDSYSLDLISKMAR